jgi:hypothetical protein
LVPDNNVVVEMQAATVGPRSDEDPRAGAVAGSAPFGDVIAITVAAVLAASLSLAATAYLLLPPIDLPEPFADQHQTAETLVFLLTFAVVLPLAVWRIPRLVDGIAKRSPVTAAGAAVLWCSTLVAALLFVRVSAALPWGDGLATLLAVMLLWWAGVCVTCARVLVAGEGGLLERAGSRAGAVWKGAAVLLLGVVAGLAIWDSVSPIVLAIAIASTMFGLLVLPRLDLPAPGRFGWVVDLAAVGLLLLAIPNLVIVAAGDPLLPVIVWHQDFFVAPASDLLAGGTLLVDTFSQYGVVSIAFIAAWFSAIGVGNGTLGLLEGVLSAFVFAAGYFVVRVSGVGRALAVTGFAIATVVLVLGLTYPIGALLQHGSIRFGMPMAILAATAVGLRFERLALPARVVSFLFVGLSSVWAFEAFGYTAFTFAAIVAAGAALTPAGERLRYAIKLAVPAAAACVAAHLIFAVATLAIAGSLPDWTYYLSTLREFLTGRIGELTYDFSAWSPGLGVGAVYVAAAVGLAVLIARRRDLALRERTATILLAGSTAYGVALLSYLVNRSSDHIVPYVSLPAFMVVMISIGLLGRTAGAGPRRLALGLALGVAALLISVAWSSVDRRFSESALAHVVPGGASVRDALARLRDMPELTPGAERAELLLDHYWAGRQRSLVITEPDLGIEALAQTDRRNLLPLSNPVESSFVADQNFDRLNEALAAIEPGELMLVDGNALRAFTRLQDHPDQQVQPDSGLDPLSADAQLIGPGGLALLPNYALGQLGERFNTRIVARGGAGLFVVELVPA